MLGCRYFYAESKVAKIKATAARTEEADDDEDAEVLPSASALSSLRMHFVLSVSSVGQTTRLKLALQDVRHVCIRNVGHRKK